LIEAAARLVGEGMDLQLRLAGSLDDDAYVQQVRNRIEHLNLRKQIVLLGRIDVEQIRKELSAASVFSLVSLEENSPMGIEEAMAASVPVITSNRCGMPYMVRDGESGFLVDPNNPTEIARCLRQLIENDSLRQSMGMKGREIALDRFHPAKVAARTREVYLRAIDDFHK
jgi:glycosyltransferase involved in cell wall biosynthesis